MPVTLLLHDGELADVCQLLGGLGLEFQERRGSPSREDSRRALDLVVSTPKRLLELEPGPAQPVRIAILSPVWFPVPPTGYGGIEWVVSLLADGLVDAGHDVTLFASGDSRTKARLVAVFDEAPSEKIGLSLPELHHALACFERSEEFDVVNDHSGPPAAAIGGAVDTAVVHTVHGPLDGEAGQDGEHLVQIGHGLGGRQHGVGQPAGGVDEHRVLVREVPVDRRAADPDHGGDLVDAHPVVATLAEQLRGGQREPRLAVLRPLADLGCCLHGAQPSCDSPP